MPRRGPRGRGRGGGIGGVRGNAKTGSQIPKKRSRLLQGCSIRRLKTDLRRGRNCFYRGLMPFIVISSP